MLTIDYTEFHDTNQLKDWEKDLIEQAKAALAGSYSPYSHFRVGAAVLLYIGVIITGSNQENGAYPQVCAQSE